MMGPVSIPGSHTCTCGIVLHLCLCEGERGGEGGDRGVYCRADFDVVEDAPGRGGRAPAVREETRVRIEHCKGGCKQLGLGEKNEEGT